MTNIAAKPTPIIPTATANPRDPYVACPLDVPVLLAEEVELDPVPEELPVAFGDKDSVPVAEADSEPEATTQSVHIARRPEYQSSLLSRWRQCCPQER
jgi:hypothetical protein